MSVFFLRMLEEKGRLGLVALYEFKMGRLSKFLDGGWGLYPRKFKCEMQQNINK